MRYAVIAGLALMLGVSMGTKAKAAGYGFVRVTEVSPGGAIAIGAGEIVGFSCSAGKENMHCYVATAQ